MENRQAYIINAVENEDQFTVVLLLDPTDFPPDPDWSFWLQKLQAAGFPADEIHHVEVADDWA